jgi:hypothetical protein
MNPRPQARLSALALAASGLALAAVTLLGTGCASIPAASAAEGDKAAGAATPAAAPAIGQPKPFADVVKDAKETAGLFRIWQKDDKVWLELAPEQFETPYFFSVNASSGLGEKGFFGGLMDDSQVVVFRKVSPTLVQLIAVNTRYFAPPKTPQALAVREAFSDSLVASAPIVSQAHPDRKSVLIEVNALLLADIPGAAGELDRTYRQAYAFDARNSSITKVRATADLAAFNVNAHYSLSRVMQPSASTAPSTPPPSTLPDIRSLFLGWYYNFAKLPDEPMRPRVADNRIGYFTTSRFDFATDNTVTPRVNYINRWRLEKKDPAAELSLPKQPIVFWLDRNIPERYRDTIVSGILEWNKAFERIGFKDAIVAKVQPEDADWETTDARHASIRWMVSAKPSFGGIGPSQVDPRTGEILDADIGIDPARLRNQRMQRVEFVPEPSAARSDRRSQLVCQEAEFAAVEMGFALDLLEARGEIAYDSPAAEQFVLEDLRSIVMHEVGHTLGLRHNFRASTVYSQRQLNDAEFTHAHGVSGSVMEYNALNIALPGEKQGSYMMSMLGPYDYWAIEYGYAQLAPEQEAAELRRIAARNTEPLLAYSTDEDASAAIDPDASQGDIGSDPLEFVTRRVELARELLQRWQTRELKAGEDYSILRRNIGRGLSQMGASSLIAARYVGGLTVVRDHAGSPRPPLYPIAAKRQRDALAMLATNLFSSDSFRFKPEFMQRVTLDYLDRDDVHGLGLSVPGIDYSLTTQVLTIQTKVLNQLMSDAVAQRIVDSQAKLPRSEQPFRLSELYAALHAAIWSELKTGRDIDLFRRNLQREHANRIATALIRPSGSMPADARSQLRAEARALKSEIDAAQAKPGLSQEAKAHLAETAATLDEALKAPLYRQGV